VIRRLILVLILLINFSMVAAYSATNVSTTTITGDEQRIGVEIPADLEPGYHSVAVESTDPVSGEVSVENLSFCKDLEGTIHWEGSCGVVTPLLPQKVLEATKLRTELPAFDPISQPKKTLETQIAAFAALSVLAAGGAAGAFGSAHLDSSFDARERFYARREELDRYLTEEESQEQDDKERQELESIETEHLKNYVRGQGEGDLRGGWNWPLTQKLNAAFIVGAQKSSRFSPALSRIFYDGNYLRAMVGSIASLLYPIGVLLGLAALVNVGAQALPPLWILFSAILVLGVVDAFAGLLAATVILLGTVFTGHISSRDELLTVIGTIAVFFAPALIASAFRPLRREVRNSVDRWERLSDYLLAAVLTGWTVTKMVGSLAGLSGIQLPITTYAFKIGVVAAIAVVIRLAGEDLATYNYSARVASLHPNLKHPGKSQLLLTAIVKTAIFAFLAQPFIGNTIQLWLGVLLFILPKIIAITVSERFPKSKSLHKSIPKGALKIVVMVIVGSLFGKWIQSLFQDPTQFIAWGFVILGLPGLALQCISFFADRSAPMNWKYEGSARYLYRFGGALIFLCIIAIALGKNLVDLVIGT